ncbi:TonB-linked SusC/RagA family outer membrane protein [Mangrovibacterium marinum]|uniref:TonB-linked SusC/RagA family outer membrane protein n=1 Tax=Mangrovibacterium marinum TaxID=1639118 RepID=A0A2T5C2N0_9BACT|nr:TonB-dependent receptor [Mangrovibacterium marinum]PTN09013.1 TonB-linked SusC/RagA family outer membrane protein [Mangrovibacterium marinum]
MKKISFFLFCIIFGFHALAQDLTIKGLITSKDDGQPLPGVSVLIKGTLKGTITDFDGNYVIQAPKDATLQFSYIGMKSQDVNVDGRTTLDIVMENDAIGVDEVVVIGYGTQKKEDLTGAVSIVNAETIENLKPVKVEQALQGTMSGVNVTAQSGAPGSGLDIRIRGISTNGDASPVAIIDGYQGDLNTLNPNDIETITVLKDAQAAIYGTVGANGIILITTKSGRKNQATKVTVNSSVGIQETSRKLPVLNATEYAVLLNEAYAASGDDLPFPSISGLGKGTNWQNELFETAPVYNNDINISGGTDKIVYSLSASNLKQEGIIGGPKTGYERNTGRMTLGADLSSWIKFKSSITFTNVNRKTINEFGLGSVLFNALNMPSTMPVYDDAGDYFLAPSSLGNEVINPLAQIENTYNDYDLSKWNGNFSLDFNILSNLTATTRIGFNTTNDKSKDFSKEISYGGKVFDVSRSTVFQDRNNYNDYTFDAFVTYDKTYSDLHHLTATVGTTVYKTWGDHLEGRGYDIPNNSWEFADIGLATGTTDAKVTNSWTYDQRRLSYFARIQYDYEGKYLLSAMLRRDASTKFGPNNTVAYFPSVTIGWNLAKEDFLKEAENIDLLKLRLSYGILGSDKIDDYQYISRLNGEATYVFDGSLVNGTAVGASPNASIKWEESEQFDLGVDLKLFNNKVDLNADYFSKKTNNLLIGNIPVSGILGVGAPGAAGPTVNAGTVKNSGFEFAVGYRGKITKDLTFSVNYNLTTLKNEVLEVNNGTGFVEGGSFGVGQPAPARMEVGKPIGYFYGYKTDGLFQNQAEADAHPSQVALGAEASPGDIRFVNMNGDDLIDTDDRTDIGSPIPDATMGLNISLNFKGLDFVAYAFASIGNDIVRNYERVIPDVNKMSYKLNRWTGEGTSNTVPRLTTAATSNTVFSDFYVEDGSFLRLQNIQLGYKLPKSVTEKLFIQSLRVYTSISNLFTITEYQGFDPAASSGEPIGAGFDNGFYPAARTYTFGLNLNF